MNQNYFALSFSIDNDQPPFEADQLITLSRIL